MMWRKRVASAMVDSVLSVRGGLVKRLPVEDVCGPGRRSVLIVDLSGLGDAVNREPILRCLRRGRPEWEIDLALPEPWAPLFESHPDVRHVLSIGGDLAESVRKIREHRYDLVLVPGWGVRDTFFALAARAQAVAGFLRTGGQSMNFYDRRTFQVESVGLVSQPYEYALQELHLAERHIPLLESLDIPAPRLRPDLEYLVDETASRRDPPIAMFHPAAAWRYRRWEPARFAELADRVHAVYGADVYLIGVPGDRALNEQIGSGRDHVHDLAGTLELDELARLCGRASVFVGNDSGPAHLSAAVGTPTLMLMGPMAPRVAGAWPSRHTRVLHHELPCCPCSQTDCHVQPHCMSYLTVDAAFTAVRAIWGRGSREADDARGAEISFGHRRAPTAQ